VLVERGAGEGAYFEGDAYADAGARLVESVYSEADVVIKVQ
jgi:alanine dehydrogenase